MAGVPIVDALRVERPEALHRTAVPMHCCCSTAMKKLNINMLVIRQARGQRSKEYAAVFKRNSLQTFRPVG